MYTRPLLALQIIVLLSVGLTACGSSGTSTNTGPNTSSASRTTAAPDSPSSAAQEQEYLEESAQPDSDHDNDASVTDDDKNNNTELHYGHAASAAERRAVAAVVKHYFTAAAADDGTAACKLLAQQIVESVVEDYGHGSDGPSYLQSGTTCPAVLTLMFKHFKSRLRTMTPHLKVVAVRLVKQQGFAIMHVGPSLERRIIMRREGHNWKVLELLDRQMS